MQALQEISCALMLTCAAQFLLGFAEPVSMCSAKQSSHPQQTVLAQSMPDAVE